ncbi:permease [Paenibacillus sabinae]|uniref:Permease n=1 Tax=Paenibacillus sabinae T27 TaxID=1268072 RepID=X4ZJJ5_9BACL|nr:permease [Paenibacillus sabinae]AHV96835.1 permease [Paenibacillus sabinae T27]
MTAFSPLKALPLLLPAAFLIIPAVLWLPQHSELLDSAYLYTFKTGFIGILLEALPFVLAGSLLSSLIGVFVPDEAIARWIPRRVLPALLFACLLGVIVPICECGMIPLVRRLLRKGMPLHVGVAFILSGPILNPVVFAATLTAFRSHPSLAYARMGLAFAVAFLIGLILYVTVKKSPLRLSIPRGSGPEHQHGTRGGKFAAVFTHAADDFFEMGKFLIFGCMLTSLIQTFVVQSSLASIGARPLGSYLFMMGFAFILSLCSTSDAFVGAAFLHSFPAGSLLAFTVLGPMLDFKNALMLLSLFKTRFAFYLFFLIASIVFTGSILLSGWL